MTSLTLSRRKKPASIIDDEGYYSMDRTAAGSAALTLLDEQDDATSLALLSNLDSIPQRTEKKSWKLPQEVVLAILSKVDGLSSLWSLRGVSRSFRDGAEYLALQHLKTFTLHVVAPSSLRRRRRDDEEEEEESGLEGQVDFVADCYDERLGAFAFKADPGCWNSFVGKGSAGFRVYLTEKRTGNVAGLWDLQVNVGTPLERRTFAVKGNILVRFEFDWPVEQMRGKLERRPSEVPESGINVLETGNFEEAGVKSIWQGWMDRLFPAAPTRVGTTTVNAEEGSGTFTQLLVTPGRIFRTIAPVVVLRRRKSYIRRRGSTDSLSWTRRSTIEEAVHHLEKQVGLSAEFLHRKENFDELMEAIMVDRSVLRGGNLDKMRESGLVARWQSKEEQAKVGKLSGQLIKVEPTAAVGFLAWLFWVGWNLNHEHGLK